MPSILVSQGSPPAVLGTFKPPGLNQQLKSLKLPEVTPAEHLICIYRELNLLSQSPLASPFPASDRELRALIIAHQIPSSPAGQGAPSSLMLCDPGPRCHLAGDGWVRWCSCSNLFWPFDERQIISTASGLGKPALWWRGAGKSFSHV